MKLPVKSIVFYKHGVGFIERGAAFQGERSIELSFKKEEMDDVLKSLTVLDRGGKVTGLSYETGEDVHELLEEKALVVPGDSAVTGLFSKLRGYIVSVTTPDGDVVGTVVGTDKHEKATKEGNVQTVTSVLLSGSDGKLRTVSLDRISDFEVRSPEAREDLDFFLDTVTSERKENTKSVTVFLDGDEHELTVQYICQMPSWRVSYRIAHDKEGTFLQGWGIIDNRLDEDLKDISVSLVAGKPISFIYDIYTPRTVERPIVREEVRAVGAPIEMEEATKGMRMMESEMERDCMMAEKSMSRSMRMEKQRNVSASVAPKPTMKSSVDVHTKAVDMGEFFRYDIENPVTIKRGQSAMVPILQSPIDCIKEHVYNSQKMPTNPIITLKVKNDSGVVLERGPVLVLDEGTYVGEAIVPYTTPDATNHIAYSVDLGVEVEEKFEQGQILQSIRLADRYYYKKHLHWSERTYLIKNKGSETIDMVIEHPIDTTNIDTDVTRPPDEKTGNHYRWKMKVEPKSALPFLVREVEIREQGQQISGVGMHEFISMATKGLIDEPSMKVLQEIAELQAQKYKLEMNLTVLAGDIKKIFTDQERLRENLGSLGTSQSEETLRAKYVSKLDEQEGLLEKSEARRLAIEKEKEDLAAKMDLVIRELRMG